MTAILSFDEAIQASQKHGKRHLLLGNGFSIACEPSIFTYGSLFEQADFTGSPHLKAVFSAFGTSDFEQIIKTLEDASKALPVYDPQQTSIAQQMNDDAQSLKDLLIRTVAGNHPKIPNDIEDKKFWGCRQFLNYFVGENNKDGRVYTLNYDLLLYWTLLHDDFPFKEPLSLTSDDGFGRDEHTDPDFVDWMGETSANKSQRVHYLHGALHLFDAGTDLQKYTWVNTGTPLLDQARKAMDDKKFPLFVAEGESEQKLTKIKHSAYLYHSYKSFSSIMSQNKNSLFIFGHSLADNDQHILEKISSGRIPQLYVSLFGDQNTDINRLIQRKAFELSRLRDNKNPLDIAFFDAASAKVWGDAK